MWRLANLRAQPPEVPLQRMVKTLCPACRFVCAYPPLSGPLTQWNLAATCVNTTVSRRAVHSAMESRVRVRTLFQLKILEPRSLGRVGERKMVPSIEQGRSAHAAAWKWAKTGNQRSRHSARGCRGPAWMCKGSSMHCANRMQWPLLRLTGERRYQRERMRLLVREWAMLVRTSLLHPDGGIPNKCRLNGLLRQHGLTAGVSLLTSGPLQPPVPGVGATQSTLLPAALPPAGNGPGSSIHALAALAPPPPPPQPPATPAPPPPQPPAM